MCLVKYPRICLTNPNLTPELLVPGKVFQNGKRRAGVGWGEVCRSSHPFPAVTPLEPSCLQNRESKQRQRKNERREKGTQAGPQGPFLSFRIAISSLFTWSHTQGWRTKFLATVQALVWSHLGPCRTVTRSEMFTHI